MDLDMVTKPTNAYERTTVSYKHSKPPAYFGNSCGQPQGGALQMIY
jgi:hypothetical protein